MDYSEAYVTKELKRLGYEGLTPDLIQDFIQKLKDDNESLVSTSNSPKSAKRGKSPIKKVNRQQQDMEEEEEEDIEEMPSPKKIPSPIKTQSPRSANKTQRSTKTPRSSKKSLHDEEDEEIRDWNSRIKAIKKKANSLDVQIAECRSAILDPPEHEVDIPMYYGTSERKLDPYPTVKRKYAGGGGFIRPPPVKANRKPTGPKGKRLLYEERFPDYVPPPERRRDSLRWQIRQKLAYSDPKYHQ